MKFINHSQQIYMLKTQHTTHEGQTIIKGTLRAQ